RGMWRLAVPVAIALAGVLFATSAGAARGGDLRGGSRTDLTDLIRAQERRAEDATQRVEALRTEVDRATKDAARADQGISAEQQRGDDLVFAAGTSPVRGPALRVTLSDAPRSADRLLPDGTSPDTLVVHQQDMQAVINALWAGGAEAVRIMDQRAIVTSALRCVGSTLILQGRVYSPPYTVTAIGDPDRLTRALNTSEGVQLYRYYADRFGLVYGTERLSDARFPGYTGSLDLLYAQTGPGA
ncbi:MAG: DUF881 domain-containing protein, partial [Actinomycetes bacterium]